MNEFKGPHATLNYRRDGPSGKPAILFHHSLGANHRIWDRQAALLQGRYQIVRFDSRGHGNSSTPPGPYSVAQFGTDTIALLDHLKLANVIFCGLSLGSMVGLWLGVNAPKRVERLILVGASAKVSDRGGFDRRLAALSQDGIPSVIDELLARWFTPAALESPSSKVQDIRDMILATSLEGYIASSIAVRDFDCLDLLHKIRCPLDSFLWPCYEVYFEIEGPVRLRNSTLRFICQ